jgi:hypothetical protein
MHKAKHPNGTCFAMKLCERKIQKLGFMGTRVMMGFKGNPGFVKIEKGMQVLR